MRCYCCSSKPFKECCEPFITGVKHPNSAEQLMRSRFSAYATANYRYILETYTKAKQQDLSVEDLAQSAQGATWFALRVHPTFTGSLEDSFVDYSVDSPKKSSTNANANIELGTDVDSSSKPDFKANAAVVEFTAYYFESKSMHQLHETSNFNIEDGKWRYHDGVLHDDCGKIKYGRNLPCVCGSNKKFKQCCGLKNR
ncbi:SEC-C domain-containing protein [Alteromonas sp. ALT199]|uniref:YchJ family protein n=1 Tax=unclassified Alteromonas TaxID=2614992 RepID=UPI0004529B06|nr:YchJ family metal-binding protein [Alteromonas sp. ALT199]MBT3134673.1 SEC-C domain-containing protein [Alteromonas sp. ALT199]